jgi:cobalt-zinc-cadmium resistance protein CzcA
MKKILLRVSLIFFASGALAQQNLTIEQVIELARRNNAQIISANYYAQASQALKKTSFNLPKTDVSMLFGQYNSFARNDNNLTITQSIPFSVFGSQGSLNKAVALSSQMKSEVTENEIVYRVKQVYFQLAFQKQMAELLAKNDSIYEGFYKSSSLRYQTGESNLLEKITAETQRNEVKIQMRQNERLVDQLDSQLKMLAGLDEEGDFSVSSLAAISTSLDTSLILRNPSLKLAQQQVEVATREKSFEASKLAPDLIVGFFTQTLIGNPYDESGRLATSGNRFTGFQVGVALPLWFAPHTARIKAASLNKLAAQNNLEFSKRSASTQLQQARKQMETHQQTLAYYTTTALPDAELILKQAHAAFSQGEIGYTEFLLGIRNATSIREAYLRALNDYNQNIIYIQFLLGNKSL